MEGCKLSTREPWIPVPKGGITLYTLCLTAVAAASAAGLVGTLSVREAICPQASMHMPTIRYALLASFMAVCVFLVPKIFSKIDIGGRGELLYQIISGIALGAGLVAAYKTYLSYTAFKACAPKDAEFPSLLLFAVSIVIIAGVVMLYVALKQFYGLSLLSPAQNLLSGKGKLTPEVIKHIAAKQYEECGLPDSEVDLAPRIFAIYHDLKAREAAQETSWWSRLLGGQSSALEPPAPGNLPNMVAMRSAVVDASRARRAQGM